jgi:hypothetical protein
MLCTSDYTSVNVRRIKLKFTVSRYCMHKTIAAFTILQEKIMHAYKNTNNNELKCMAKYLEVLKMKPSHGCVPLNLSTRRKSEFIPQCIQSPNSWTKSRQKSSDFSSLLFTVTSTVFALIYFFQTHATSCSF